MMDVVIKIEEKIFEELTKYDEPVRSGNRLYDSVLSSIYDAIPLPKGHDRLIYAKDVGEYLTLADVPTIIEADKLLNNELENPFNDNRFGG